MQGRKIGATAIPWTISAFVRRRNLGRTVFLKPGRNTSFRGRVIVRRWDEVVRVRTAIILNLDEPNKDISLLLPLRPLDNNDRLLARLYPLYGGIYIHIYSPLL